MNTNFPLFDALLCVNCDHVFERGPESCPCCTSRVLVYLSSLVKPMELREEIGDARAMKALGVRL